VASSEDGNGDYTFPFHIDQINLPFIPKMESYTLQ
jgi:hypothetical protein